MLLVLVAVSLEVASTWSCHPQPLRRRPAIRRRTRLGAVCLKTILLEAGASEEDVASLFRTLQRTAHKRTTVEAAATYMTEFGFTGSEVAQIVEESTWWVDRDAAATRAELAGSLRFLEELKLKKGEIRRVGRVRPDVLVRPPKKSDGVYRDTGACPAVLAASLSSSSNSAKKKKLGTSTLTSSSSSLTKKVDAETAMRDVVLLLESVGLKREKYVKEMVVRWPQIFAIDMAQLLAVTDFFASEVGSEKESLGTLYRHAPWILAASVGSQLRPALEFLRGEECGVRNLDVVVRAYPRCLIADVEKDLRPRVDALRRYGVAEPGKLVETFPLVFGLDVNATMDPAVAFFRDEVGVSAEDVPKICRAFPSLLGVDVAAMRRSVKFLKEELGVCNVARFVTRLPPVLAYDIDAVLRPKMKFAVENALSVYDISRFPAFFSYPLDDVIRPRAAFLKKTFKTDKVPLAAIGLNRVLTPQDKVFAKKANATPEEYAAFKRNFLRPTPRPDLPSATKTRATEAATTTSKETKKKGDDESAEATTSTEPPNKRRTDGKPPPFPPILHFPRFPT